jgi:hypothetical protein
LEHFAGILSQPLVRRNLYAVTTTNRIDLCVLRRLSEDTERRNGHDSAHQYSDSLLAERDTTNTFRTIIQCTERVDEVTF